MKDPDVSLVLAAWSLTMMRRAFGDLAVSFASVDRGAADKAMHAIEVLVAAELTALRDKPPKGIVVPIEALKEIAGNFREMTQSARNAIQQAAKPH